MKKILPVLAGLTLCLCCLTACGAETKAPVPETSAVPEAPAPTETPEPEAAVPPAVGETKEYSLLRGYDRAKNLYLGSRDGLTVFDGSGKILRRFRRFYAGNAGLESMTVPGDGTVLLDYADGCSVVAELRSNALAPENADEMRLLLTGYWDYYLPGESAPAMELFLTGDGYYHAYRLTPEGADPGFEYVGEWTLGGDEALPEQIAFPFLGKTYDPDIAGYTSLGTFSVSDAAVWDGAYCLRLAGAGENDFFRTVFGDSAPILRRRSETPVIPAATLCRRSAEFPALCWGVTEDAGAMTLWLSLGENYRENGGQLPAVLPCPVAENTALPDAVSVRDRGGFSCIVQTDENGALCALHRNEQGEVYDEEGS